MCVWGVRGTRRLWRRKFVFVVRSVGRLAEMRKFDRVLKMCQRSFFSLSRSGLVFQLVLSFNKNWFLESLLNWFKRYKETRSYNVQSAWVRFDETFCTISIFILVSAVLFPISQNRTWTNLGTQLTLTYTQFFKSANMNGLWERFHPASVEACEIKTKKSCLFYSEAWLMCWLRTHR